MTVANQGAGGDEFNASVPLQPNRVNDLFFLETTPAGQQLPAVNVEVVQDATPPSVFIDFPANASTSADAVVSVAGRVADSLSGFMGLTVDVNGVAAVVNVGIGTNGTFEAQGVTLMPAGTPTVITASATDVVGNSATAQITITRVVPSGPQMTILSGANQSGPVDTLLPRPIEVLVTQAGGNPFPNKLVTFVVCRSNGRVSATGAGPGAVQFQTFTDGSGIARAFWRLGSDAGCGNNRVRVRSLGVESPAFFCASANSAPASRINIGSGTNQMGAADGPLPAPFRAWVNDGCNGVGNVPVTFTVRRGTGFLTSPGQPNSSTLTILSSPTGHAQVGLTLGATPGVHLVEATFPGNAGQPATFVAKGVAADPMVATSFRGVVLDNAMRAIEGAQVLLEMAGVSLPVVLSDAEGQFVIPNVPLGGPGHLHINGLMATTVHGPNGPLGVPMGSFPSLEFAVVVIPNVVNTLPMPVLLPELNPNNAVSYDTTSEVELCIEGVEGLRMIVAANTTVTLPGGAVASPSNPVTLALNQVHFDEVPMPMPDGASPPFAWTLQPSGATFDPPVKVIYPNMTGLPAGSITYFLSFDHAANEFQIVATGQVEPDGSCSVTDPGSGISTAGWGCQCPPYPPTGDCCDCDPKPNGCGPEGGIFGLDLVPDAPLLGIVSFQPACNTHDVCYGTCGNSKSGCDSAFFFDMAGACSAQLGFFHPLYNDCVVLAFIYYSAVALGGGGAYAAAQMETCDCLAQCQSGPAAGGLLGPEGPVSPPVGWVDLDFDFMDDNWETSVGLDPSDPTDALLDNDVDELQNLAEFIHRTHPFNPDTNNNGTPDGAEALMSQPPRPLELNDTFTASIGGQTAPVSSVGSFRVTNVAAANTLTKVGFVGQIDEETVYGETEFFEVLENETYTVSAIAVTNTPPVTPLSLVATLADPILMQIGVTTQVTVIATLNDGNTLDVTPRSEGTTYASSNVDTAIVDENGLVTAMGNGLAFITATNQGATTVARVTVSFGEPTTVQGFVQLANGSPAVGASVTLSPGALVTNTDVNGAFSIPGAPTQVGRLTVFAQALVAGQTLVGFSAGLTPVPGGFTDAGIITIAENQCAFDPSIGPGLQQGDDDSDFIQLVDPAGFDFYGLNYTGLWVNSNGNITFGGPNSDFTPTVGEAINTQPRVCPCWVDLNPASSGDTHVDQLPDRVLITWNGVPEFSSGGSNTIQAVLHASGRMDFVYNGLTATGGTGQQMIISSSPGGTPPLTQVDYSSLLAPFSGAPGEAIMQVFNSSAGLFDLDFGCLVWQPDGSGGYAVTFVPPTPSPATATVQGTVTNSSGSPAANADVIIRSSIDPGFQAIVQTDTAGAYSCPSVPCPGGVTVTALVSGTPIAHGAAVIDAGQPTFVIAVTAGAVSLQK